MGNFYLDDTIQTQVIQLHLEMSILSSPTVMYDNMVILQNAQNIYDEDGRVNV